MKKIIGSAADFYRLRVFAIDTTDGLDLEWRDDVLYRRAPSLELDEDQRYEVQAVTLGDEERTVPLATFDDAAEAHSWMDEVELELPDLTKSDFEGRYFPESDA